MQLNEGKINCGSTKGLYELLLDTEEYFYFSVSLFDYHSGLKHNGCVVRAEKRDGIDKKGHEKQT